MLAGIGSKPIPTGRLARMWSLGTLQGKIAMAYMAWWLRSGFQDADSKQRGLDETRVSAAIQVLAACGESAFVRGGAQRVEIKATERSRIGGFVEV
jgi:aarF domain-containing kinase